MISNALEEVKMAKKIKKEVIHKEKCQLTNKNYNALIESIGKILRQGRQEAFKAVDTMA